MYIWDDINWLSFNLKRELIKSLDIYNNTKRVTKGFTQKFIFDSNDDAFKIIKKATQLKARNILIEIKNKIIENNKGLVEKIILLGNKIKKIYIGL